MRSSRRLGVVGLFSALVLATGASSPAVAGPEGGPDRGLAPLISADAKVVEGSYIVLLETGAADKSSHGPAGQATARARDAVRQATADKVEHIAARGVMVTETYHSLGGFAAELSDRQLADLRSDPDVLLIEQDRVVSIETDQTNATWGLDRIDQRNRPLDGTYSYDLTGQGVSSYIIDTGIRSNHSEFSGRVAPGATAIDDGRGTEDCNGHGTHVAGTAGGTTYGVAKQTTLVPVRVLGCDGSGSNSGVIAGMDWVADNASGPSVANMSLGGGVSTATDAAVDRMVASGVTVVVAAGNENQNACNVSPARAASALTVASTTSTDARSSFSNYGSCVDIFAPGSSITSAWYTSTTATNTISGTSMASPHVAGAAALYLQAKPQASPSKVGNAIVSTATNNVVSSPAGSPNRLLYTLDLGSVGTDPDPDPQPGDAVTNGDFEAGATGWSGDTWTIGTGTYPARSGDYKAWLNGYGQTSTETIQQTVTVPSGGQLVFYLRVDTAETTSRYAYDTMRVQVVTSSGSSTRATYSNLDRSSSYQREAIDLSAYAGQTVQLRFVGQEDSVYQTSFLIDDVSLSTS